MNKRRPTDVWISQHEQDILRALAAALGLLVQRGPGAGQMGSISGLMQWLANDIEAQRALLEVKERKERD